MYKAIIQFNKMDGPASPGNHLPSTQKRELCYTYDIPDKHTNSSTCDIVFCFDTTGSMSSVLSSLREHLSETVERLFREITGLRIGIIGHGDYCDTQHHKHLAHICPLTTDLNTVTHAIKNIPSTGGGDAPEAYEYMLHLAHTSFNWKSDVKVFVIIADEIPHEAGYRLPYCCLHYPEIGRGNKNEVLHIDWRKEMKDCKEKKIVIFSCHALAHSNKHAVPFYTEIAESTGGYYFTLDDLQSFYHYMNTICFKAADAAEDLQIMKDKKESLIQQLKQVETQVKEMEERGETGEHLEILRTTSSHLTNAFCDLSTMEDEIKTLGIFKSPAAKTYSNKLNRENPNTYRKSNRTNKYISEPKKAPLDSASLDFLNKMREEEE